VAQARDTDEVMLVTNGGMLIRMKVKEISVIGRNTQGVRLISLESADEKVTGISRLPEAEGEEGTDPGAPSGEGAPPAPEPQGTPEEPPAEG
jgi:DNA gyrase subunit A